MQPTSPTVPPSLRMPTGFVLPIPTAAQSASSDDLQLTSSSSSTSPLSTRSASPIPIDQTQAALQQWRIFCLNVQDDVQFSPPINTCALAERFKAIEENVLRILPECLSSIEFINFMNSVANSDSFEKADFRSKYQFLFNADANKLFDTLKIQIKGLSNNSNAIDILDRETAFRLQESSKNDQAMAFFFSEVYAFVFTQFYATDELLDLPLYEVTSKLVLQQIFFAVIKYETFSERLAHAHFSTMQLVAKSLLYRDKINSLTSEITAMPTATVKKLYEGIKRYESLREGIDAKTIEQWPEAAKKLYIFLGSIESTDLRRALCARILQKLGSGLTT